MTESGASPPSADRVFGRQYAEEVTLRDGTRVRMRQIRASDKQLLVDGLEQLSPQSRYLRFFTDKERLTDRELRYFTEVDGEDHFALGASTITEDGAEGTGIGIGRFVRLPGEPTVAEPALAVVDSMHGRGLGRLLMLRLISAAAERGIRTFRSDFLAINRSMEELLRDISPTVEFHADGPVVTAEFPLPNVAADAPAEAASEVGPLFRWLSLVAEQVVELRQRWLDRWHELQRRIERQLDGGDAEE